MKKKKKKDVLGKLVQLYQLTNTILSIFPLRKFCSALQGFRKKKKQKTGLPPRNDLYDGVKDHNSV